MPRDATRPSSDGGRGWLGIGSGVGLVMANMIGAGVFLSTGFMAQEMGPGAILLAWVAGGALALCGALAYAEVARVIPRSGGEYRYLSTLWHPLLGSLAGWGSLLLGFSAPIAIDAFVVGAFLNTLLPEGTPAPDPRLAGTALILLLTVAHAAGRGPSRRTQDALVTAKILLLVGFIGLGLALGASTWPTWTPPSGPPAGAFPWGAFLRNQYWIAFAFSGWNAAIYIASEFRSPDRDVPRALLLGCGAVGLLYLAINTIFVVNLRPDELSVVFRYEEARVTLGHALLEKMGAGVGADAMSAFAILAFASAMSAMTIVGPRVYAEMARDGYLPRALAGQDGQVPAGAVLLQGGLCLLLLWTHSLRAAIESAGGVLLLFSALTALGTLRAPQARTSARLLGILYAAGALAILVYGVQERPHQLLWLGGLLLASSLSHGLRQRASG